MKNVNSGHSLNSLETAKNYLLEKYKDDEILSQILSPSSSSTNLETFHALQFLRHNTLFSYESEPLEEIEEESGNYKTFSELNSRVNPSRLEEEPETARLNDPYEYEESLYKYKKESVPMKKLPLQTLDTNQRKIKKANFNEKTAKKLSQLESMLQSYQRQIFTVSENATLSTKQANTCSYEGKTVIESQEARNYSRVAKEAEEYKQRAIYYKLLFENKCQENLLLLEEIEILRSKGNKTPR